MICFFVLFPLVFVVVGCKTPSDGDYPFQAYLSTGCSGALISHKHVISAAHCIEPYDVEKIAVFFGSIHFQAGIKRDVLNKTIHPDYINDLNKDISNDIGIVHFKSVDFTKNISSVDLPPVSSSSDYEGSEVILTGWKSADSQATLQHAMLEVISNESCKKKVDGYKLQLPFDPVKDSVLCATSSIEHSVCHFGPLIDKKSKVLIGTISFGIPTCAVGTAGGGYTRITTFRKWISEQTGV